MKKVLVIGANSRIAQWVLRLLDSGEYQLTLFLRNPEKLPDVLKEKGRVVIGDATNYQDVSSVVKGQDVVYASLAGDVINAAKEIVKSMEKQNVQRLIWTSSLGIYNEIPGEFGRWNQQVLGDYYHRYRQAADIVEASSLDYTIVRPAWLTDIDEINYETTHRNDPFKGTEVSRKSVASYVVSLINDLQKDVKDSVGIDKPGTDGDRPRSEVMKANGGYEPSIKENIKVRFP